MSNVNIYIIRLEGGKYYIGKSDNVMNRYQQHIDGNGSAWTRKYKPISLEKIIKNVSSFEEDKITKEYMSKYGIDNVRGGSYVEIKLSEFPIDALKMEIWAAKNLCTQCGSSGHFVKNCHAKTDISGNKKYTDEWECEYCDRTFTTRFGCVVHEKSCKNTKKYQKSVCYRCGRTGHYSPYCYANTHIRGYTLD